MKQIFDWLREQTEKASIDICCGCGTSESKKGIFLGNAEYIINEAEAKWEADCCEWKHRPNRVNCICGCKGGTLEHDDVISFSFCPYCGKKIKILEVE